MSPRKIAEKTKSFSATGVDTAVDMSTGPMKTFGLQIKKTGSVTAWTVVLEGSLDGTNFDPTAILSHTESAPGDGKIVWTTALKPVKKIRMNCSVLTGAGTVECALLGVP